MQLILMKSGGKIIYNGALGHHSSRLIEYFQVCSNPKLSTCILDS